MISLYNEPDTHETDVLPVDEFLFRLRDLERIKGDGDLRGEQQFTLSHVLLVVTKGRGTITMDHYDGRLRPNAVYVCPPGETFGVSADPSHGLDMFLFRFDVFRQAGKRNSHLQVVREQRPFPVEREFPASASSQLLSLCEIVNRCWQSGDVLERFRSQIAFQELLYCLLKSGRLPAEDSKSSLARAKAYMDQNFDQNVTIEKLAHLAGVSPKYFVDLFKKTYGISAIDYLTQLRVNRAKTLMARSGAKLRDIAHQVGYHDEFYFSRKFKKEVGVPPTVYMKSRRRKIAAYSAPIVGHLLALRIIPYAAPLHPKWTSYYYQTYRSDIAVHLSAYRQNEHWESNIDMLRQARPDVIISMDTVDPGEKQKLEEIAPVLYVPSMENDWREQLRMVARFLGESAEAEHWLKNYERKVEAAREQLANETGGDTFLIVRMRNEHLYAYCNRSMAAVFYGDLRMVPAYRCESDVYNQRIELGRLAEVDADRLLLMIRQEPETLSYWKALRQTPEWRQLKAVRNNRVYVIPPDPWREYSAAAHERIVEECVRMLSGNRPS
ncbi:AraC family transcriptional regulator [Brevibacillus sp. LEMMJ03]|uniref:AraC family transcriptional regulator n=1 Tax=Brevibacillus sp. LEMMJ03 TaxID=2595056 RepID=UPI0021068334|nr:AraC family transcriptional regulator [Brevibacillus sp. LEMMJ03]